ncbi:AAA family ATPase [Paraburkholderia lycopersici]|uniref:AAA+-type ATPase, SpoVK/Ycf46/Vps4 family n=1 Tax=Paraburkholderia lycopersici TaxID=416944 RepID=A0A1G6Q411_9BURK|nr:ATP-binding protein [Paraburkholderia lycopersici]SDC86496.1 AAA+-type ATPase, SpoVK/Ycf46/Vps4 family [Paraburkholderia lycopersici]
MKRRRTTAICRNAASMIDPVVKLWLLRLLVPLGGQRNGMRRGSLRVEQLADIFSLHALQGDDRGESDENRVAAHLRRLYREMEGTTPEFAGNGTFARNLDRLEALVGLTRTDRKILEFVVMLKSESVLEETSDLLGALSFTRVFHTLSVVLDLPADEIRRRLGPRNLLARSGLVSLSMIGNGTLDHRLDLLSGSFADHMRTSDADPLHLLRDTVVPASPARLALADYEHIGEWLEVLQPYLRRSLESGRAGVNIFVYGPPGTGKTELAKTLAQTIGCELFEVASQDDDGDPVDGDARLRAFRAAQSFFGERRALLLFDEVEDVFNGDDAWRRRGTAQARKAWINRMLESNRVPALWVSNSVDCLDNAFIRRFDMVIELPVPPKRQRCKIIGMTSGDLLEPAAIERLAGSEVLAPAVVTRVASVVRTIRDELGAERAGAAMERLINGTLKAQSQELVEAGERACLPKTYDAAFIRADSDLVAVAAGLGAHRSGRLCLYGPPGTGKTAFGQWLAQRLDAPLIVKRASDLLSKWLGENEKNIASAFREAANEEAILLIDEVDGFLRDRRGAARSWEVTAVNEMLTQMERFQGIFIASTNLIVDFDPAALRRFDLKVKFDYLAPEQAWCLLERQLAALELPQAGPGLRSRLDRLGTLTPGDFAAVARRQRFLALASAEAFVEALEKECAMKEVRPAAIGFV